MAPISPPIAHELPPGANGKWGKGDGAGSGKKRRVGRVFVGGENRGV